MDPFFATTREVFDQEAASIGRTFVRQPVVWTQGEGCRLWDKDGRRYLDFFAGHAVMNLGYGHPAQLAAMRTQLERLVHTGNLYYNEAQVELARRLVKTSFGGKVFFANSGAEITELAIKLARKHARAAGDSPDRHEILTCRGSFHGRTFGALSATGQDKYHAGLEPMLPGFRHVPFNDPEAMAAAITPQTCAVLLEPIQGEGGIWPARREYLEGLRAACDRNRLLLIFDEIQCGLGRCGTRHAYEYYGVVPDVLLLGKPLGGGLPISALITRAAVAESLQVGDHGSTFGGNPVAAAGGCVLLAVLEQPGFLQHLQATAAYLEGRLAALAAAHPRVVKSARGLGLMQALELHASGPEAVGLALQEGLVINCTAGHVLRLLPPLVIGQAEVDEACGILERVLQALEKKKA